MSILEERSIAREKRRAERELRQSVRKKIRDNIQNNLKLFEKEIAALNIDKKEWVSNYDQELKDAVADSEEMDLILNHRNHKEEYFDALLLNKNQDYNSYEKYAKKKFETMSVHELEDSKEQLEDELEEENDKNKVKTRLGDEPDGKEIIREQGGWSKGDRLRYLRELAFDLERMPSGWVEITNNGIKLHRQST